MTPRKDRYVVGYRGEKNVVYGKAFSIAEPMTAFQAHRALKQMPCNGAVIFKLVPVVFKPVPTQKVQP